MHYPQLPDPNGWDVQFANSWLADDWMCTQSGPVNDIHLWVSYKGWTFNNPPWGLANAKIVIWSDLPAGISPTGYSMPNLPLWTNTAQSMSTVHAGSGVQGWYNPSTNFYTPDDHNQYFQLNITGIGNPFVQQQGNIYWLSIQGNIFTEPYMGWKTSTNAFQDTAVHRPLGGGQWTRLKYPDNRGMDLAFVITPEPTVVGLLAGAAAVLLVRRRSARD